MITAEKLMEMPLDRHRLVRDLKGNAERARALKRVLRTTWTRPMSDEQVELHRLAVHSTRLCVLRALLRGKYHLPSGAMGMQRREYHERVAERAARPYLVAPAPVPSGALGAMP